VSRGVGARLAVLVAAGAFGALGGCDGAPPARVVRVFAAASLSAPFTALAAEFERSHPGATIELHFAGTPQLVLQLREGAQAGVFAAADEVSMQRVVAAGQAAAAPSTFAHNRLAIVVPADNPQAIAGLADLVRPGLRVALCGPEVPAGRYAREALARAGVALHSVSDEPSVTAVVAKVQLGELDAGIVYRTDTTVGGVTAVDLDPAQGVTATYTIVPLVTARPPDVAAAFVAFVVSPAGQRLLAAHGFVVP